ncbi:S phase cyclin A-associated protein in the endoplasmic reticulum-like isoform X2 [Impatiens glandulifera]|uniref:S phase cyclin A-associated protein in the endoplasmic reticulum-like isoform X2 n=1 Tax=Impatiens glandulifera TaxID=253017 RepID=UPI001FB16707|nr:S phase cyclin A-associated protein in the endoplasmic reticulum-like isoform X2 [Impatiens glandulifera]
MENVEDDDDQSSGWLLVKKKHRSSSKISLQGWVAGNSVKNSLNTACNSALLNGELEKSDGKHGVQPSKAGSFSRQVNPTSVQTKAAVQYFDKCVVSEDIECSNSTVKEFPEKCKPSTIQNNIFLGLTEENLTGAPQGTVAQEIRFGEFGNVPLLSSKSDSSVSSISASSKQEESKQLHGDHTHQLKREREDYKGMTEDVKVRITDEILVNSQNDVSDVCAIPDEHVKVLDDVCPNKDMLSDDGTSDICEVPPVDESESSNLVLDSQDSDLLPCKRNISEASGGPKVSALVEDIGNQISAAIVGNAHNLNDVSASGSADCKERFRQRLWCFLFENLNRAVDELYLLCELECDLEQVKEAILVLQESALDFKELKSRVEEFEKLKKSSSQLTDGPLTIMKSDHRRTHALSWEVRRMTTSPQHAEILSSSLETFRKFQEARDKMHGNEEQDGTGSSLLPMTNRVIDNDTGTSDAKHHVKEVTSKPKKKSGISDLTQVCLNVDKRTSDSSRSSKMKSKQNRSLPTFSPSSSSDAVPTKLAFRENLTGHDTESKRELQSSEIENMLSDKERMLTDCVSARSAKYLDALKKQTSISERDKEKRNGSSWKSMDAWKEKRNWEDILTTPLRTSSRFLHSSGISRKTTERARILHDKLMSPDKRKKTSLDLKRDADAKHVRAMRIRSELENGRVLKIQRNSEKVNRVSEWQAVRSMKLREGMYARHQRSESRHEAHLAQVVRRAGDESSKVNEVRFITSLNEENKKFILRQKLHDSEVRRAEILQVMKSKQKEDVAREEAVLERKKLIEFEKLQRLTEIQRRKEEAQLRREEERKASSAVREARAMEHMRRKEFRAKAQQEEAELLAQKLAEKLSESEQRRKFYLEQIRERASMDFRDQSPLLRRTANKDQGRSPPTGNGEDYQGGHITGLGDSTISTNNIPSQNSLKRRIKKIRQRLMSLKYEYAEAPVSIEHAGIGYRTLTGIARAKIGRWLQELQKLRQARKEGAASIGLIIAEMIKFLEGKDPELQACRQTDLIEFIASALPASHTSKPETCKVTIYFLRLLKVVLSIPANRGYFIAQNLLPPIIPMLAAALENYIKIAASAGVCGSSNLLPSKTSVDNLESISEALDGFLWTVAIIIGHVSHDDRQIQLQDGLQELVIAYQVIHRLRELFALYDRPQVEGSPFPSSILSSINLLTILTSRSKRSSSLDWESIPNQTDANAGFSYLNISDNNKSAPTRTDEADFAVKSFAYQKDGKVISSSVLEEKTESKVNIKQPVAFLLSAISETGLVCLPSLLTAVLLQANNHRFSSEQATNVLPSNFDEVATGVLKVLNNLALIDITFLQSMLGRPDLKMELFHLMSFLLSYCSSNWRVAVDRIGLLLLESLSLLGYFALFHPNNQAVLRWGKSPTILHKVCDLPFVFFSDAELMPVLTGTLVAACYGCEQNKGIVQQELSTDMILSLLNSCKTNEPGFVNDNTVMDSPIEPQNHPFRSGRYNPKNSRLFSAKSVSTGNGSRTNRGKILRPLEEKFIKPNRPALETSSIKMLHSRFPASFIDRAEQFFSAEISC